MGGDSMTARINFPALELASIRKGWGTMDLQKAAGLSTATLYVIRKNGGKCRPVTFNKIAAALGVDVSEIVTFPDGVQQAND